MTSRPDGPGLAVLPMAAAPEPDPDAQPEQMVVPVDTGERIAYLAWGGSDLPPLVLVHGLSRSAWSWSPVARRLARVARVVAVDLRGHGASDSPREGYDLESLAADVLTVASANGWGADIEGPPVVVAGHGFGAMVAATMAVLRPGSVAAVALVDGGWESMAEATRMSPDELVAAIAEPPEVLASMETWLADRRAFDPATWDDDQERAARTEVEQKHAGQVALRTRPSALRRLVAAMYAYRPQEALTSVACPMLVVVAGAGGADDDARRERLLALEDVERERATLGRPPAHVIRLDGVGHDVMRHRPGDIASSLASLTGAVTPGGRGSA